MGPRPEITRRSFLLAAAGTGLAACGSSEPARGIDVVVVGAGLAGLTAAHELARAGAEVTVVEARERVGGRVETLRSPFVDGQHVEAGGEFIDRPHTAVAEYVDEFGLELVEPAPRYDELDTVVFEGRAESLDDYVAGDDDVEDELERFAEASFALAASVPDPLRPADAPDADALDSRSVADFIDELDLDPHARFLAESAITSDFAAQPGDVSLLFYAQQEALYADVEDDDIEIWRIGGGNQQLAEALAASLGDSVRRAAPVQAVSERNGTYEVNTLQGSLRAQFVVIATPLPPLRSIAFDPPLPRDVADAIANLGQGAAIKTMIQYEARSWLDAERSGDAVTTLPIAGTWEATSSQSGTPGVLTAYTGGAGALDLAAQRSNARIAAAASDIERIFPSVTGSRVAAATAAWPNEQYTQTGFSAYAPGQVTEFWNPLRSPIEGVYLAGEHTAEYVGSIEGAVRSGQRAAAAISQRS